jgi:hypothetical protein
MNLVHAAKTDHQPQRPTKALLALVAGGEHVTTADFRIVFLLIALIPLVSALGFLRLSQADGAEVSGYRAGASVTPTKAAE